MRKIIGSFLITVGLVLIGIGSYNGFEKFGNDLFAEHKKSYYDGLYLAPGDSVTVSSEDKEVIKVSINSETYEFKFNGSYYEDEYSGFYIYFTNDQLTIYKDGEEIRTLYKEK